VHPIADLQIEYSLIFGNPERQIFPALAELGIGATLYGVRAKLRERTRVRFLDV
jgi:aryl-alcohol dehydrogenase-like predicted oxidoreductase